MLTQGISFNFIFAGIASAAIGFALAMSACRPSDALTVEQLAQAEVAFESCLICHSVQEMQRGPIVDGLPAWYTRSQLERFAKGIRGQNPENKSELLMGSAQDRIGDAANIDLLARYIESRPPQPYLRLVRGDRAHGAEIYQTCIPCHGLKAEGNELLKSPPLTIQEDWYLLDQMRKFARGERGYHPDDIPGIQMAATTSILSDQDMKDVVAYLQTLAIEPAD